MHIKVFIISVILQPPRAIFGVSISRLTYKFFSSKLLKNFCPSDKKTKISKSMSTPSSSINHYLAAESLTRIFVFLPPEDRVRLERVCRHWRELVQKYGWVEFRTLELSWQQLKERGDQASAKYQALLDRCTPHLREFKTAIVDFNADQWAKMRNLRHVHFDMCVSSATLRAVADNLMRLQSIHFSHIDCHSIVRLHDLLHVNNATLQALHLPLSNSLNDSLCLPALPSSLRLLHLGARASYDYIYPGFDQKNCDRVDELLELAASCCPQLGILMLPSHVVVNELSLVKLPQFERLFYLRLCFAPSQTNLLAFGKSLAKMGAQLRALLLGVANSRILQLVAEHCPLLEHCSLRSIHYYSDETDTEGQLLSALQSVFQLAHLRSLYISYICNNDLRTQILDAIGGLNAKGTLEYLQISGELSLSMEFVTKLIQLNPKLRKLSCQRIHMHATFDELNTLLQNTGGPLELELFDHQIQSELETGKKGRVWLRRGYVPEIVQPMLRQLWARTMHSVPELVNLD